MMVRVVMLILLLCGSAAASEVARSSTYPPWLSSVSIPQLKFQRGDDPQWARPDLDDSGWEVLQLRELPSRSGIYWVRWRVGPQARVEEAVRDGLLIKVVASYDLYWDGQLIGRNGRVGANGEEEQPGSVDALFQIPPHLAGPGEHVVALRMSSWNTGFRGPTYGVFFRGGNFRALLLERSRAAIFSVMAVGAALVVAVVFGLMWLLAGRRLPLLLFSLLFMCVAGMQALQAWRWLFEYPYDWHFPRLVTITALVMAMSALLPAFVMHHFQVGRPRVVYPLLAVLLTGAWFMHHIFNVVGLYLCAIGFTSAAALALQAAWQRKRGAVFASAGLAASIVALVIAPGDFLDHAFFISAGPAVLGLLVALVLQLRDERREAQRAVLTAARLEIELLKKNIQPHFLLNTLATIQEVIEQEPRTAVTMVEALANEFRILSRVSGERLVTMEQELELCRAHLRVMSLRKGARCALEARGVDEAALVPPALFHTLIENGLTHLLPRDGRLEFELRAESRAKTTRYVLLARGQRQRNVDTEPAQDGTGLRYIKARLEESFTGRWSLTAGPVLEGWETVIEIVGAAVAKGGEAGSRSEARGPSGSGLGNAAAGEEGAAASWRAGAPDEGRVA